MNLRNLHHSQYCHLRGQVDVLVIQWADVEGRDVVIPRLEAARGQAASRTASFLVSCVLLTASSWFGDVGTGNASTPRDSVVSLQPVGG